MSVLSKLGKTFLINCDNPASTLRILADYPEVLTTKDLRQILRISRQGVYDLIRSGVFHTIQFGRVFRIPKRSVEQFLAGEAC